MRDKLESWIRTGQLGKPACKLEAGQAGNFWPDTQAGTSKEAGKIFLKKISHSNIT